MSRYNTYSEPDTFGLQSDRVVIATGKNQVPEVCAHRARVKSLVFPLAIGHPFPALAGACVKYCKDAFPSFSGIQSLGERRAEPRFSVLCYTMLAAPDAEAASMPSSNAATKISRYSIIAANPPSPSNHPHSSSTPHRVRLWDRPGSSC
jgi:hypothetical protein